MKRIVFLFIVISTAFWFNHPIYAANDTYLDKDSFSNMFSPEGYDVSTLKSYYDMCTANNAKYVTFVNFSVYEPPIYMPGGLRRIKVLFLTKYPTNFTFGTEYSSKTFTFASSENVQLMWALSNTNVVQPVVYFTDSVTLPHSYWNGSGKSTKLTVVGLNTYTIDEAFKPVVTTTQTTTETTTTETTTTEATTTEQTTQPTTTEQTTTEVTTEITTVESTTDATTTEQTTVEQTTIDATTHASETTTTTETTTAIGSNTDQTTTQMSPEYTSLLQQSVDATQQLKTLVYVLVVGICVVAILWFFYRFLCSFY